MENEDLKKMVILAVFSALASVVSLFAIPMGYAKLDFSFFVIFFIYTLYGIKEAVLVSAFTAFFNVFTGGSSPFFIGEITMFASNAIFAVGMHLATKTKKYISYPILVVGFAILFTILNYFIITPIYFNGYGMPESTWGASLGNTLPFIKVENSSYFVGIFLMYFPFNLVKGIIQVVGCDILKKPYEIVAENYIE